MVTKTSCIVSFDISKHIYYGYIERKTKEQETILQSIYLFIFILVSLVWELKEYINSWKYTNIINTYNYMKTIINVINIRILYFQSIHHFMANIKKKEI